jgi:hypothetical protein|tara:strand:- start:73 stop:747 length:675 start_codon:yes stop_codon:yes gene_type:complete
MDTQTGKPIKNVNVFVGNNGTTTNSNGSCNLDIFNKNDQITFSMIGYRDFTLPFSQIPKVVYLINESIPMELVNVVGESKKSRNRYIRLERNVRKVYPYANKISELLVEYSSIIDSLEEYSGIIRYQKKREIFSKIEDELISKYGHSIKKLTKSQGRILIRLVDRETNRTSYKIIKDFRNIFSAGFWQITARVFGHNLRSIYNPNKGEDRMIEYIINRIEKKNK